MWGWWDTPSRTQVTAVARHELAGLARDGRVRVGLAVVCVLALTGLLSGAVYYQRTSAERLAAGAAERDRWESQPAKNSHDATHYGVYVFKPPAALALIDRGIESFVGSGVWLEAHRTNLFRHRPIEDATTVARFGELTAALTLQVLAPLLILMAGYATVSGERENGTWRQLVLSGAHGSVLIAGKLLGMLAAVAAVGLPLALVVATAVFVSRMAPLDSTRVIVLAIVYAAYLAGWAILAVAVSAWTRSGRAALVTLLALWCLGCVVGPRLVGDAAGRAYPVPSQVAFRRALDADIGPHNAERVAERKARILREYGVSRTEDLPIDWRGISLQEEEERTSAIYQRHFDQLMAAYQAQNRLLHAAGLLVPSLAVQALSQAAAGTDIEHHQRFVADAEAHRQEIQRLMNADVTVHDREGTDYKADPRLWRTVPTFSPNPIPFGSVLPSQSTAIAALVGWLAMASLACTAAVRRLVR
jgi:ABC-2 type transport system permease protein